MKKAKKLIKKFGSVELAICCVDILIEDLNESLEIAVENHLHPHVEGIISGSLYVWRNVKEELLKVKNDKT
jgi:hypothetical protein